MEIRKQYLSDNKNRKAAASSDLDTSEELEAVLMEFALDRLLQDQDDEQQSDNQAR